MSWLSLKGKKRLRRFKFTSMRFIPQHKCWGFLAWIHVKIFSGDHAKHSRGEILQWIHSHRNDKNFRELIAQYLNHGYLSDPEAFNK